MKKRNINIPIYLIMLLPVILVGTNLLNKHYFIIFNQTISLSVFTCTLSYFLVNQINKKSGLFLSIFSVFLAIFIQLSIFAILYFLTNEKVVWIHALGLVLAFVISTITNIILYSSFIKKNISFLKLVFLYALVGFLYELVLFIVIDKGIITGLESYLLIVNLIHIFVGLILAIVERVVVK